MEVIFGKDYELIDSGAFEKLERFGKYTLRRPEPQAIWPKSQPEQVWQKADAYFKRSSASLSENTERGEWLKKPSMPEQWYISYQYKDMELRFRLGMTSFKHVGIFPEQACNWNFIYDSLHTLPQGAKVLNLFAYTGGASLAAKACGADVTHLDAVKQVINWSHDNMEASGLDNIRWVVEDALTYLQREAKRDKQYQGIILDPPAYGRGPKGEKWILEESIMPLMEACSKLIDKNNGFIILNLYSMGFSPLIAQNLLRNYFPYAQDIEYGDLSMKDRAGNILPLSIYARFIKK